MSVVGNAVIFSAVGKLTEKISENLDLFKKEKDKPQAVKMILEPDSFSYTELGRATTILQSKQKSPDLEFKNPLDSQDVIVTEFSIIPNSSFKTKGMVELTVNDVTLFKNKAVADFTDISESVVKIIQGKTIKPSKSLKVFIWSPDGTSVSLTNQVTFGE